MLQSIWRKLGRPALCAAALATGASLAQAQLTIPQPAGPLSPLPPLSQPASGTMTIPQPASPLSPLPPLSQPVNGPMPVPLSQPANGPMPVPLSEPANGPQSLPLSQPANSPLSVPANRPLNIPVSQPAYTGPLSIPNNQPASAVSPITPVTIIPTTPSAPVAAPTPGVSTEDKARIERLEKELQDLKQLLQVRPLQAPVTTEAPVNNLGVKDVQQLINTYMAEKEAEKKVATQEKVAEGYKVGTDLRMSARWNNGLFFETPNKDFSVHLGTRFHLDSVWFNQSANTKPPSQIGDMQDGIFFRRLRIQADGTFWEICEFNTEFSLENIANGSVGLFDCWVGVKDIPFLGTIRVGHIPVPQGLEPDDSSSSKAMTFLERAAYTEAFYENIQTGIWVSNSVWDQRATATGMFYRQARGPQGNDFGDGTYAGTVRFTGLPIYQNDGRCLLHLGASGSWRKAQNADPGVTGPSQIQFRARPEIFDSVGGDNGFGSATNPGDSKRWVDTGKFIANSSDVYGVELCYIHGPFWLQAEYAVAVANNVVVGGKSQGNLDGFNGGYVQVSYFLTGENRTYDKRLGRLGTNYITNPNTPFWLVRENGGFNYGLGAWELAARWSHVDLNDGVIRGGMMDNLCLGVNWHLNNHLRINFDYVHANRYNLVPSQVPGNLNAFGIRTSFFF